MNSGSEYNSREVKDLGKADADSPDPPQSGGGQGVLEDDGHVRADLALIGRAIKERWDVPPAMLRGLPRAAVEIVVDTNATRREKLRAIETIRRMQADNQSADEVCIKLDRLDEGLPTERIELKPITLRVTERINPSPSDSPPDPLGNGHNPSGNGHSPSD